MQKIRPLVRAVVNMCSDVVKKDLMQQIYKTLNEPNDFEHLSTEALKQIATDPVYQTKLRKDWEDTVKQIPDLTPAQLEKALQIARNDWKVNIDQARLAYTERVGNLAENDAIVTKLNTSYTRLGMQRDPVLLSKLYEEHKAHKQDLFTTDLKALSGAEKITKQKTQTKIIHRQQQYYWKFIAIADDYDIQSTDSEVIFNHLIKLFSWPNENQKNSPYSTKKEKNLDWYKGIAEDLEDIRDDPAIEKSVGTVQEVFGWLQELYKYAVERKKYLLSSPVAHPTDEYKREEKIAKTKRGVYRDEEIKRQIEYVISNNHPMKWPILLMCYTGCRNSELYRIKKSDINALYKYIYINGTKTKAAIRYIPLANQLIDMGFIEHINSLKDSDFILSPTATREYRLNQELLKINAELEIPELITNMQKEEEFRGFYSFRKSVRTYATGRAETDIIETFMGHKITGKPANLTYQSQSIIATFIDQMRPIVDNLPR